MLSQSDYADLARLIAAYVADPEDKLTKYSRLCGALDQEEAIGTLDAFIALVQGEEED